MQELLLLFPLEEVLERGPLRPGRTMLILPIKASLTKYNAEGFIDLTSRIFMQPHKLAVLRTEAQGGQAACLMSHSYYIREPGCARTLSPELISLAQRCSLPLPLLICIPVSGQDGEPH